MVHEKSTGDVYAMKVMKKSHILQQADVSGEGEGEGGKEQSLKHMYMYMYIYINSPKPFHHV